ncbi:4834_t:CDS:1, partial [Funneliformis mosseae]
QTVREARLRFRHWIIQYDLGAHALSDSFGSSSRYYGEIVRILRNGGFNHAQDSIYCHMRGCTLQHAIQTVGQI